MERIAAEMKFLEQMLEEGILSVAVRLETELGKSILLADNGGEIFYSLPHRSEQQVRSLLKGVPALTEKEYYYHKREKLLFYQFANKEHRLLIGIDNVEQADILDIVDKITLRSLALKTYLDMQGQLQLQAANFEKKLVQTLVKSSANIHDIIGFHNIDLKTNQEYGILLFQVENPADHITSAANNVLAFCKQMEREKFFSLIWNDVIIVIMPAGNMDSKQVEKLVRSWKTQIEENLAIQLSCGIGRFYLLNNLHRSYIEAKIALAFPELMGKQGGVQNFDSLGVFSMIFSQDIASLKAYVVKALGPILIYDREMKMQLVETLRILLKTGFNWAKTAKDMFVHVNTIHYRYDKIEKILSLDLSQGRNQCDVYAALKVWDVLNKIGFVGDDFFPGDQ